MICKDGPVGPQRVPEARRTVYPRVTVPGATAGVYGIGSGISYSAPQVAGAAALVWAADPTLTPTALPGSSS